jgi:uncharacterized protein (DUF58 family)
MGVNLIIYIPALLCSALFYVLYPYWFSNFLFVSLLLIAPFDLIISLPGMLLARLSVTAPTLLTQGEKCALKITLSRPRLFPAGTVSAWLRETDEDVTVRQRVKFGAALGNKYELVADMLHSGVTFFSLKRFWASSLLGLFSIPVTVNYRAGVLVLPAPVKPAREASLPRGVILRPKPGGGFSEDYDLRPYREGDPILSVHWKLSAKYDSLIVREALCEPPHRRLISVARWRGALERDIILGRLRFASEYLLKNNLPYYIKLEGAEEAAEIKSPLELSCFLCRALDTRAPVKPPRAPAPSRFTWVLTVDARDAHSAGEAAG